MKPLLLGMNNPLSDDPEFDLYPYPEKSTGWRLWKMLPEGTTRAHYLGGFERRDLLRARVWDKAAALEAAHELLPTLAGRRVVVLGTEVRAALGLPAVEPLTFSTSADDAFSWLAFPHPSGRNRWYSDDDNYDRACAVLTAVWYGKWGP